MASKKKDRSIIKLVDKEPDEEGKKYSPSIYYTVKNRKKTPEKLELKKFNKYKNKHTKHKEENVK